MYQEQIQLLIAVLHYERDIKSTANIINELFKGWSYESREDNHRLFEELWNNLSVEARSALYFLTPGPTA